MASHNQRTNGAWTKMLPYIFAPFHRFHVDNIQQVELFCLRVSRALRNCVNVYVTYVCVCGRCIVRVRIPKNETNLKNVTVTLRGAHSLSASPVCWGVCFSNVCVLFFLLSLLPFNSGADFFIFCCCVRSVSHTIFGMYTVAGIVGPTTRRMWWKIRKYNTHTHKECEGTWASHGIVAF